MSRGRLVVAGGGIAGLLAATAASDAFDEVLVVDAGPNWSQKSPRSAHRAQLHNVLTRGQQQLEELLPGFAERLMSLGGVRGSVADDTHVYEFGGCAIERPLGLSIWSATWGMIWEAARSLMPASIEVRFNCQVTGLNISDGCVTSVVLDLGRVRDACEVDAVVDATGFASRFTDHLAAAGGEIPAVSSQRIRRWFVSYMFKRPEAWFSSSDFWMVFTDPPERHVALLSPLSRDHWTLSVSSEAAQLAPRDLSEVFSFLDSLPGPPLRPLLADAQPIDGPHFYRRREVLWRHYEEVASSIRGFAPLGDAYAALNPVFGQGVSIASWQASTLRSALHLAGDDPTRWTERYLSDAATIIAQCWGLDQVPVPLVEPHEWSRIAARLAGDERLQRRYIGIWHLLEPPEILRTMRYPYEPGG